MLQHRYCGQVKARADQHGWIRNITTINNKLLYPHSCAEAISRDDLPGKERENGEKRKQSRKDTNQGSLDCILITVWRTNCVPSPFNNSPVLHFWGSTLLPLSLHQPTCTKSKQTTLVALLLYVIFLTLGSFSNDDGNGNENAISKTNFPVIVITSRLFQAF